MTTRKELEKMFNVKAQDLDKWEAEASEGILPGKACGEVVYGPGRPMMFGEETHQIGFREPASKITIISRRAKNLGMRRSDYLRKLVDEDLRKVGMI